MTDAWSTPLVAVLCLAAMLAVHGLVRRLRHRRASTLRSKLVSFVLGLAGAELSSLPALAVAFMGDELFGLRGASLERGIAIAAYVVLTVYVVVRLFPWREVAAMTAEPDASLRDIVKRLTTDDDNANERGRRA